MTLLDFWSNVAIQSDQYSILFWSYSNDHNESLTNKLILNHSAGMTCYNYYSWPDLLVLFLRNLSALLITKGIQFNKTIQFVCFRLFRIPPKIWIKVQVTQLWWSVKYFPGHHLKLNPGGIWAIIGMIFLFEAPVLLSYQPSQRHQEIIFFKDFPIAG